MMRDTRRRFLAPAILAGSMLVLASLLLPAQPAAAASLIVTTLDDHDNGACDADCTLREAINAANLSPDDDVITFSVDGTITLTADLPEILPAGGALTISGNGPADTVVDAVSTYRLIEVNDTAPMDLVLEHLSLMRGSDTALPALGGVVTFDNEGTLTVDDAVIAEGNARYGGGLYLDGTTTVTNSIVRGNVATTSGSGIFISAHGALNLRNALVTGNAGLGGGLYSNSGVVNIFDSTISGNTSTNIYAAGVHNNGGAMTIVNSILSGNTNSGGGTVDCYDATAVNYTLVEDGSCVGAGAGNLSGSPLLDASYVPRAASPVINAGDNASIPAGITLDLAGQPRIQRSVVDMGAFESPYPVNVTLVAIDDTAVEGSGTLRFRIARDLADADPLDVLYTVGGTAGPGDYTPALTGVAQIPANALSVDIVITPVSDAFAEPTETIELTLVAAAGYTVGTAGSVAASIIDDRSVLAASGSDPAGPLTLGILLIAVGAVVVVVRVRLERAGR